MKFTFIYNFIYFLIFINFYSVYSHRCGTDSLKIKPYKIEDDKINKYHRRVSNEYTPIKIIVDYTQLQSQNSYSNLDISFLKERFNNVAKYFSSLLSVQHLDGLDIDKEKIKTYCNLNYVDGNIVNIINNNDVVIFPYIDDDLNDQILAAAASCLVLTSYRPIGGIVALNSKLVTGKQDSNVYFEMLLLHELSHVLAFHPEFFEGLKLMSSETINGVSYSFINSPKVLEKAKIHFNCGTLKGIQLEDQGGDGSAGSHWESRYMLGDYMISTDYTEVVISDITLALFEDTGFYKVNYYTGGLFRFGKNQGCSFLEEKCVNNGNINFSNEFCIEPGKAFCGSSHISRGICSIGTYTERIDSKYRYFTNDYIGGGFSSANYCPVSYTSNNIGYNFANYNYPAHCQYGQEKYSSIGEIIGENSLCFESSLVTSDSSSNLNSICYEVVCNKLRKQIIIKIGSSNVVCPGDKVVLQNPDGFKGTITCPEYNLVCSSEVPCNDMIDCINKKSTSIRGTYLYLIGNKLKIKYFLLFLFILYLL